jgi:Bifunctional DNA primase/polymerase, N-terminal
MSNERPFGGGAIMSASMLKRALHLARKGLRVFPCRNTPSDGFRTKSPLTRNGFRDATIDERVIGGWWRQWPDALIGVPVGERFCLVDLDLQHAAAGTWWEANKAAVPITRMHRTQSGGLHVLFSPDERVGCTQGRIHPHVDTRGQMKGYAIWWPACGLEAINAGIIAPVPEFIIAVLTVGERQAVAPRPRDAAAEAGLSPLMMVNKVAGIVRLVATAPEGQRNAILFWGACRMGELVQQNAITAALAADLMIEAAARAGLSIPEARRTVRSALVRF